MTRSRARYERVFAETYGDFPYDCYFFCGQPVVDKTNFSIHHLDHDEANDAAENLVPAHGTCHNQYHFKHTWSMKRDEMMTNRVGHNVPHSEDTKQAISEMHKASGHTPSMEARSLGGKVPWTDERRANQSQAQSNRSPEWREKNAAANRGKKRSEESRRRMSEAAKNRAARKKAESEGGDRQ